MAELVVLNRPLQGARIVSERTRPPPRRPHTSHFSRAQLEGPEAYRVLSDSGCTTLEGVDDAAQFLEVRKACGTIGMDKETQNQVRRVLPCFCQKGKGNARTSGRQAGLDDTRGEPKRSEIMKAAEEV